MFYSLHQRERKKSTEYISRVQSNMAAKGHTQAGRLKGQTETFNRVKCAVVCFC